MKKNSTDSAGIEQMFDFCNLCAWAELHQQERKQKLCSATSTTSDY